MREWYIRTETYGTTQPHIVDEEAMYQAERGMNYINPNEFIYLCDADCLAEAIDYHAQEAADVAFCKAHDC